jgi:hypothetical protein
MNHFQRRKQKTILNALEENLILERCMIFSMAGFSQRSWQIKELALDIGRRRDLNFYLGYN